MQYRLNSYHHSVQNILIALRHLNIQRKNHMDLQFSFLFDKHESWLLNLREEEGMGLSEEKY
jgi:hypothetical protein